MIFYSFNSHNGNPKALQITICGYFIQSHMYSHFWLGENQLYYFYRSPSDIGRSSPSTTSAIYYTHYRLHSPSTTPCIYHTSQLDFESVVHCTHLHYRCNQIPNIIVKLCFSENLKFDHGIKQRPRLPMLSRSTSRQLTLLVLQFLFFNLRKILNFWYL